MLNETIVHLVDHYGYLFFYLAFIAFLSGVMVKMQKHKESSSQVLLHGSIRN